jgi:hypothetical protein
MGNAGGVAEKAGVWETGLKNITAKERVGIIPGVGPFALTSYFARSILVPLDVGG